jgi:hypothetical protein
MKRQLVLAAILLLAGCEEEQAQFRNRDPVRMTQQQYDADSYQCDHDNQKAPVYVRSAYGAYVPFGDVDHKMATRCMQARGWYRVR